MVVAAGRRSRVSPARAACMAAISRACTPITFTCGARRLDRGADAADEAAAAHGHQHRVQVRHLLQQLEPDRALAGDDPRVVEGMDEDQPALGLDLAGAGVGLVEVLPVQDDLRAAAAGRRHLGQRRPLRHDDDGGDAELRRVERDAQAVVARAGRDDAAPALVGGELQEQVGRAALLEGARHLQVLQLDVDARAGHRGEGLRVGAGRLGDDAGQPRAGRPDVGGVDHARAIRTAARARRGPAT